MNKCNGFIAFLLIIFCKFHLFAQCDLNIQVDSIIQLCDPTSLDIVAEIGAEYRSLQWRDENGVLNDVDSILQFNATDNTTLYLDVFSETIIDDITNGDFDLGNTGFSSEYFFFDHNANSDDLYAGFYAIADNPTDVHDNFTNCGIFGGDGNMMIINGSEDMTNRIWCQTITTIPNAEYVFRARAASVHPNSPAKLRFAINGQLIGNQLDLPNFFPCIWENFEATWTASNAAQAEICITNQNTNSGGNDFALDQIFFGTNCVETHEIQIQLNDLAIELTGDSISCDDQFGVLNSTILTDIFTEEMDYQWSTIDGNIAGTSLADSCIANLPGIYTLLVTDPWGCNHVEQVELKGSLDVPIFDVTAEEASISCDDMSSTISIENLDFSNPVITWSLDGNMLAQNGSSFSTLDPGLYEVTVTNPANNCSNFGSITIEDFTQDPGLMLNEAELNCLFSEVTISNLLHEEGYTYNWLDNPVSVLDSFVNISQGGNYHVMIENEYGCTNELSFTIDQNDYIAEYNLFADTINCSNQSSTINTNLSTQDLEINWSNDIGFLSNNQTFTVEEGGLYYVSFINELGCEILDTIEVIDARNIPEIIVLFDSLSCGKPNANISIQNFNPDWTYNWLDEQNISLGNGPSISTDQAGNYTISVIDQNDCTNELSIEIIELENQFNAINPIITDAMCEDESVILEDIFLSGAIVPIRIFVDGQEIPLGDQTELTEGLHNILVVDANGCEQDTNVTINLVEELSVELAGDFDLAFGEETTPSFIFNKDINDIISIEWSPSEGLSCTDCLAPIISPKQDQNYSVTFIDSDGCEETITFNVSVSASFNYFIPNVIQTNSDNINQSFTVYTSEGLVAQVLSLQVFDRWGNQVFNRQNFAANDPRSGWIPAEYPGELLAGVYVYLLEFEWISGEVQQVKGDITLLR